MDKEIRDTIMYGEKIIKLLTEWVNLHADLMGRAQISKIADASDVIEKIVDDLKEANN